MTSPVLASLFLPDGSDHDIVRVVEGDLAQDAWLVDLVLINLATDRRARESDAIPDGASRRGWALEPADGFGSRLWLLEGQALTTQTLRNAEDYAREALAFLVDDGIASAVTPSATRESAGTLGLTIRIDRPTDPALVVTYAPLWSQISG